MKRNQLFAVFLLLNFIGLNLKAQFFQLPAEISKDYVRSNKIAAVTTKRVVRDVKTDTIQSSSMVLVAHFDRNGNMTEEFLPESNHTNRYRYDASGNCIRSSSTNASGQITQLVTSSWDKHHHLLIMNDSSEEGITRIENEWTKNGDLSESRILANGKLLSRSRVYYDEYGSKTGESYYQNLQETFSDKNGNLLRTVYYDAAMNFKSQHCRKLDSLNRPIETCDSMANGSVNVQRFTYDAKGVLLITDAKGTVLYDRIKAEASGKDDDDDDMKTGVDPVDEWPERVYPVIPEREKPNVRIKNGLLQSVLIQSDSVTKECYEFSYTFRK